MPLTDADKQKYKSLYLQSAKPYILDLKKIATLNMDDSNAVETIHRAAHSMGSQSLMMEYNSIGQLSRLIERIFKAKVDGEYEITPEVQSWLVKVIDRMEASISAIETENHEIDLSQDIEALEKVSKITV